MTASTPAHFDVDQIVRDLASQCGAKPSQVQGAVDLLGDGNTIPFIARYRKERTGGLDEGVLRIVDDALTYHRELAERKATVLKSIEEQGKLDAALRARILACSERRALEELYLPYRPRRRTRATIARERGLEPLADVLRRQELVSGARDAIVTPFVAPENDVPDAEAALRGACDILAEEWSEDPEIRQDVRATMQRGQVVSKVKSAWRGKPSKFESYYDFREPLGKIPSHRYLAMRRGQEEGVLSVRVELDDEEVLRRLRRRLIRNPQFLFRQELEVAVEDCCRRLLFPSVESASLGDLKEQSDDEAIQVFAQNLRELLLAAPAGQRVVLGLDPGFRTGCKVAVIDRTGGFVENATIYPTAPRNDEAGAKRVLAALLDRHDVELIAIGNGTASRETDAFVSRLLKEREGNISKVTVSEAGASVYSASETARREFPDLDVTVRGAISIARRLQDPLAELVKIDPKAIGVGQYQHDIHQGKLRKALDREVESCVNRVGVDLNTASAELLAYVAGIGAKLGEAVVRRRQEKGPFRSRKEVLDVPRLGARAMTQAAGFLRIRDGDEPLDNSAVHPETYHVVEKMAVRAGVTSRDLIGNSQRLKELDPAQFVDDKFGLPTIEDILGELEKPGRDPRRKFEVARFADGIHEVSDLKEGMVLEAVITNVTRFGAFADVGVHQDGLIHVSELDSKYVKDPGDVVAVGDIVKVKVLGVEPERRRIALSRKQLL